MRINNRFPRVRGDLKWVKRAIRYINVSGLMRQIQWYHFDLAIAFGIREIVELVILLRVWSYVPCLRFVLVSRLLINQIITFLY